MKSRHPSDFNDTLKPLVRILDIEPYLTGELITVAKEIARESTTVLIRVLETILPAAMRAVYQTKVQVVDPVHLSADLLALFEDQDEITLDAQSIDYAAIKKAIKNNHLRQVYDVKSKAKARFEKQIELIVVDKAPTSEKQKIVLRTLLNAQNTRCLNQICWKRPAYRRRFLKPWKKTATSKWYSRNVTATSCRFKPAPTKP
ncbi:MAG: hypothetical protein MZU97_19170 [Bacillus subtilis]|nr:hypothetical protein [Bacillus subtilis]